MTRFLSVPMDIHVALAVVGAWLTTKQPIEFRPHAARAVDAQHFTVAFEQTSPVHRLLQYQIVPEAPADCWRVVEVAV